MATSEETLAAELPGEDRTVLFASGLAVAVVVGMTLRRQIRRFVRRADPRDTLRDTRDYAECAGASTGSSLL